MMNSVHPLRVRPARVRTPSHSRGFFIRAAILAACLSITGATAAFADARADVDAAYAKLASSAHRKREMVLGPMAAFAANKPVITEWADGRSRQIFEMDLPQFGHMRVERVTVGSRIAVRTIAPGVLSAIERAKAKATASSVRSLIQQIVSLATAAGTGGLSSASAIQGLLNAAATAKSIADARRVLDQAADAFKAWHEVKEEDDPDMPKFDPSAFPQVITSVGKQTVKGSTQLKYLRKAATDFPGAPSVEEFLFIDEKTGLPIAEETVMNGQKMMRVEYFDFDAGITIELPDVLK